MTDLAAWLLEQIDADKQVAQDKADAASARWPAGAPLNSEVYPGNGHALIVDPCRVLAECEVKRRIVDAHLAKPRRGERIAPYPRDLVAEQTLSVLASVYVDRPGYDESWRP